MIVLDERRPEQLMGNWEQVLDNLIAAIDRLSGAIDKLSSACNELGDGEPKRYTSKVDAETVLVTELGMADQLGIRQRRLAEHRRSGKLPGCWVKNGRRVLYDVEQTLAAWRKGLS